MNKLTDLKPSKHTTLQKPGLSRRFLKDSRFRDLYHLVRDNEQYDQESRQKAQELLNSLEHYYPREPSVLLLALEVISRQPEPDVQGYHERLAVIMQDTVITESSMEMRILHLVLRLCEWSRDLATRSVEELLLQRLVVGSHGVLLEKAFVTYIWMQTSGPDGRNGLKELVEFIPKFQRIWRSPLSVDASHAALMIMWRRLDSTLTSGDLDSAEQWGRLALNPLFSNFGDANRAKIQRKLVLCALRRSDADSTSQFTDTLFELHRSESLTIYLLFKLALIQDDLELAKRCIADFYQVGSDVSTYLYACIAEAQRLGKTTLLRSTLHRLVDGVDKFSLSKAHLALLFRCTIRLDIEELERKEAIDHSLVQHLCGVFEFSYEIASQRQPGREVMSISDYEWFSQNSYNLALQHCCKWESHYILHLLETCMRMLDLYPKDLGSEARSNLKVRGLMSNFLAAVVAVTQARAEGDIQLKEMHCTNAKTYIENFRSMFRSNIKQINEDFHSELHDKYRALLLFDFEASIQLKEWNRLDVLLVEACDADTSNDKLHTLLADAVLRSGAPSAEKTRLFATIVKNIRELNLYGIPKTSRWLRCLFQLALESDTEIAEQVLSQIHALAKRASNGSVGSESYPAEELEWLSATVYNRAIDLYLASEDAASRRWYELAVGMARLLDDGGYLSQVLEEKFGALTWEE